MTHKQNTEAAQGEVLAMIYLALVPAIGWLAIHALAVWS